MDNLNMTLLVNHYINLNAYALMHMYFYSSVCAETLGF